ncbi:MAG TPA: aminotransferase class IV [Candidatus Limnocylindrales bacterium]|nr:aminotransferase class IV [Candidatus Limnocylindrales bacterium]
MTGLAGRHIWIHGAIEPADARHLSAFDRGFQLGDGVFETLRARGGKPTELREHLARLRRSGEGLDIDFAASMESDVEAGITALLEAEGLGGSDGDASIRITASRGPIAGRGLLPAEHPDPTVVIQAWPVPPTPAGHLERGLHLVVSAVRRDPASPLAPLKTTSRADYVYARLEARRAGADDALFLTTDGRLSEATSANIFLVRDRELATPGLDCAILPGTTRSWILGWAGTAGLAPVEGSLGPADLAGAAEAFLCSSVAGILPLTRFEGRPIGDGRPGTWTMRARAAREAFIAGDATPGERRLQP